MKIYFMVHATSEDNEKGIASGWRDTRLSEVGRRQAAERRTALEGVAIDRVFCSDLARAVETARLAFGETHPVVSDSRLRELNYGDYNGQPREIVDPMKKGRIEAAFPGGESYGQAVERVHSFLKELQQRSGRENVVIVGHSATKTGLDTFFLGKTIEECLDTPLKWQPFWEYK